MTHQILHVSILGDWRRMALLVQLMKAEMVAQDGW
jgi:hypothetical protein